MLLLLLMAVQVPVTAEELAAENEKVVIEEAAQEETDPVNDGSLLFTKSKLSHHFY